MRHLIVSREFPPAPYPPGGIGTYVSNLARLLVEAGETVHLIAQRWSGAPAHVETSHDGRFVVHRIGIDRLPDLDGGAAPWIDGGEVRGVDPATVDALAISSFPPQAFAYRAALLAEWLVEHEGIDIIEAQEWEAPLAYFQLRRALGLGPERRPPCLVHLHSPTEFIFRHNEWSTDRADYLPSVRLEDFSISAADGWLCPSEFLADQAAEHYAIPREAIDVIPLPRGDTPIAQRDASTWRDGTICFVGRLEPRKGIMEWVDAALHVADEVPALRFEFIGSDLPLLPDVSVQRALEGRIPARHRERFTFLGSRSRPELMERLAHARIGVVPSRWENFPNTCLEAMASGLPVLASPNGGMREMVVDGESGWIATSGDADGLAAALRRALATPPAAMCAMGVAAANRVRKLCDNDVIVARHLEVRGRAVALGATRSHHLPAALPWSRGRVRNRPRTTDAALTETAVGAIVIAGIGESAESCVASVEALADRPARRVLVTREDRERPPGWEGAADLDAAIALLTPEQDAPGGVVVMVEAGHVLHVEFLQRALAALRADPRLGVVAPWTLLPNGACEGGAAPALPYQLLHDLAGGALVFRASALHDVRGFPSAISTRYWCWDAATAVMSAGWGAVAWPELLVRRLPSAQGDDRVEAHVGRLRARRAILERASAAVGSWAVDLVMELEARQPVNPSVLEQSNPNGSGRDTSTGEWVPSWPSPVDPRAALASLDTASRLRWATSVLHGTAWRGAREPARAAKWFFPRLWMASREAFRRMLRGRAVGGGA